MNWAEFAIGIAVLAAIAGGVWMRFQERPTQEELERRRRLSIHATGKLIAGQVTDIAGEHVVYRYKVAGVEYTATQNVGELHNLLPEDRWTVMGAAGVKFDRRNPANSIVICEEWSGLRRPKARSSCSMDS